jgi:diguanylate cyclase (GGDEF)-like protein/PAS domain S-box-containing protein
VSLSSPVRLGLMAPLSGVVALYGNEIVNAAQAACAMVNDQGGIGGQRLELVVADDSSDPETAVAAARQLVAAGCSALVGTLLSNARIAVSTLVAEPLGVPLLNFSFSEGSLSGRHFFHFAALPNQQLERMLPSLVRRAGPKVFFAGNQYEWPIGSIDACKQYLEGAGGERVGERYLPLGVDPEAIERLLDELERAGADVFMPFFAGNDQIAVLSALAARGIGPRLAIATTHFDELMAARLPAQARAGIYCCSTYFMSFDDAGNRAWRARLDAMGGHRSAVAMTTFGAGAAACVLAFAQAVTRAGTTSADALVAALEQADVEAPQGRVQMDPSSHHALVGTALAQCDADGQFHVIERYPLTPPEIPERYRRTWTTHSGASSPSDGARINPDIARAIVAAADAAILVTDQAGTILEANPAAYRLFGYSEGELAGHSVHVLVPPHLRAQHAEWLARFAREPAGVRAMNSRRELLGYHHDGRPLSLEASIAKTRVDGEWRYIATLRDIARRRAMEEQIEWQAAHDPLTGLANRRLVLERISSAMERAGRSGAPLAVLLVDLDEFKPINDVHGHAIGDAVLIEVARRLLGASRSGDLVARQAGDEFVIVCEQLESAETAAAVSERVVEALREPIQVGPLELRVTASVGVAVTSGGIANAEQLLNSADTAMYEVKQRGRDGWGYFSMPLQVLAERRIALTHGLRAAIEREELSLVFQPIVDVDSGRTVAAEALLRWAPAGGGVGPAEFIPLAESSGSIHAIGLWAFRAACLMLAEWQARWGASAPQMSVNLSPRQLEDARLPQRLSAVLAETGVKASALQLEVTESSLVSTSPAPRQVLDSLVASGFRIAIDDFGTAYASLLQLLELPIHVLKIDRAFISGIGVPGPHLALTHGILELARELALGATAEGVETPEQHAALKARGGMQAQGFLYARALAPADFIERLDAEIAAMEPAKA